MIGSYTIEDIRAEEERIRRQEQREEIRKLQAAPLHGASGLRDIGQGLFFADDPERDLFTPTTTATERKDG